MSDTNTYDLIVIGTGAAATTAAWKGRSAGWSVALIDSRLFGGTCALRGCDPKKVLVGAAEVIDLNRCMKGKGIIDIDDVKIRWHDLMHFKRSFTEPAPKERTAILQGWNCCISWKGEIHWRTKPKARRNLCRYCRLGLSQSIVQ